MSRLIAFGCSITYGHGLPDCFVPPYNPGPAPSNLSWPGVIARSLAIDCVNVSMPGSSNKRIWHSIINFEFNKDDKVFILWSYRERSAILKDKNTVEDLAVWIESETSKAYYKHLYTDYDLSMQTKLYVSHANLFLKEKEIEVYNLVTNEKYNDIFTLGDQITNHIPLYICDSYDNKYPKALDNNHPGVECHEVFAYDIVENIKCR